MGSDSVDIHTSEVTAAGLAAGLDAVGIAAATPFVRTKATLLERRAKGLHGDMAFTYRNPERSTNPSRTLAGARSLVVGALGYRPAPRQAPSSTASMQGTPERPLARVAAYAQKDHYGHLRAALSEVAELLRAAGHKAVVVADDNALVDREAARQAGLGWYGKNSNILLPGKGSWFVLGSVITTAQLEPAEPLPEACGACRRCIDGCPTGAIVAPGVVDARRCLAWLVQAEGDFPEEFRTALGNRIYGCDDCQEVCPPNRPSTNRPSTNHLSTNLSDDNCNSNSSASAQATVDLIELLGLGDEALLARYGRWYIPRRQPRYLRRNALVALGNSQSAGHREVVSALRRYMNHDDPMLVHHARWAATQLGLYVEQESCVEQEQQSSPTTVQGMGK